MSEDPSACRCIICRDYGDRDRLDNFDLRTIVHVQEYGWSVVLIPSDDDQPGWAYTIGLWHSHRSPELAMFGLDMYDMETCLNNLGNQVSKGLKVTAGQERSGIIEGHKVAFRPVDPRWYEVFFAGAVAFHRRPPLPVLELVWPDPDGAYPWQDAADPRYHDAQPRLWLPPADHPKNRWTRDL